MAYWFKICFATARSSVLIAGVTRKLSDSLVSFNLFIRYKQELPLI